jgi:hypothetical protein
VEITRTQALRFRHHQHRLAGEEGSADGSVLELGAQDTGGPDAARWALAIRGCELAADDLVYAWTLRGAPHAYLRQEAADVAAATWPYDESDAAKRVFDAAKPLRAAGIAVLAALDTVAEHLRDIVVEPTVKGEVSSALTDRLPEPYLRWCRPCEATHTYEQPFRLAALRAGLELVPGTSPPVLRRIEGWSGPSPEPPAHLDPVRAVLRRLGPAAPKHVAEYLDAPVRTVRSRWPDDVVEVTLEGATRSVLAGGLDLLRDPPVATGVRLLGPYDTWLQARDRDLLVADAGRRKALWPVLGRPGAILDGHEIVGTWRPRTQGDAMRLQVDRWDGADPLAGLDDEAERLASHRGRRFAGLATR